MIKPLGDKILIEVIKEEKMTASGIVIPDTVKEEKPQIGIVIIGKEFKKGTKVLFSKYGPVDVKLDEKNYVIADLEDLLAIIE